MENELRAPRAGRVVEVKVSEGQTVEKGDLLAVIA
ncbi:MAG: biotin/lipoyl-binding protein [Deltaproteobacteria bacterium]|nr:biotin/lipoyl-binding protein [Deltaproteobacteria bacterium]